MVPAQQAGPPGAGRGGPGGPGAGRGAAGPGRRRRDHDRRGRHAGLQRVGRAAARGRRQGRGDQLRRGRPGRQGRRCWSSSTARSSAPSSPRPQAQQVLARSNFERAKELRRNNAGTQRALDEADAALRTADALGRPRPGAAGQAQARGAVRRAGGPAHRQSGRLRHRRHRRSSISSRSTRSRSTSACRSCSCRRWRRGRRSRSRSTPIPDQAFTGEVRALEPAGRRRRPRRGRARRDRQRRGQAAARDCSPACA